MALVNWTPDEMEALIGEKLRALRLSRNLDQKTLAERAGVSVRALRSLESGQGSTLATLVRVLRALGREAWLDTIAPVATINPVALTREAQPRQRASRVRRTRSALRRQQPRHRPILECLPVSGKLALSSSPPI